MRRLLVAAVAVILCGCATGKVKDNTAQGNAAAAVGAQAGEDAYTGFQPHDMGTAKAGQDVSALKTGRDIVLNVDGGRIGLAIIGSILALGTLRRK